MSVFPGSQSQQQQQAHIPSAEKLSISPTTSKENRRRRSSSIISHVEPETIEIKNDQEVLPNLNANWVHFKGAWLVHIVIIALLRIFYNLFPVFTKEISWTLTNVTYVIGSYIMFHQVKGTPFEFNSGAYDNLTMWEQIDNGDQYTPVKKFLMGVPIALFLISTHYSNYDIQLFILNFTLCLVAVIPKLPISHRVRITIPFISEPQMIK
ncbi:hypothetical protein PACTADRAFT_47950 [Pachysolen tannophilus NRRL Y-2460]|uniref:Protein ORM1 n=1 Tax=Pachysolen tannophilus NRRL Y-2460 TaxID=669874 RepID=A0A1E4U2L4_PACTA|nr:hypothetical protein PACTADRAFT_47950 [Pachysolen tannophilus NRRL Y-2460]